ncbi:serine hydrolase domain-containing protein [Aggregatimonas sangjinii]|nr:serine hydrolase domain-containing protein [Aggregatimonas sangjinii]
MQKNIFLIASFFIGLNSLAQEEKAADILNNLITENKVVGAVGGYAVNGVIVWQAAVGYADKKKQEKFELETRTRMASIAKPMTAVAIMQLVEQGVLDLDTPIQNYIADYPKQAKTQITTRHLLSHTSGLNGYKNGREAQNQTEYPNLEAAVAIFKERELLFEPGTRYSYTTYGYTVLGLIIEKVSGDSYEAYMQKNIWDKAGMTQTGVEKFSKQMERKSNLYHKQHNGKIRVGKKNNLSNRVPGGGLYTTLGDMLKFGNAILENTLIKESTLATMREHHSLEKEANGYGFGWFLYNPKPNEGAIIGHSGEQTGASTQLVIVPSTKTIVVILSNTSGAFKDVTPATFKLMTLAKEK